MAKILIEVNDKNVIGNFFGKKLFSIVICDPNDDAGETILTIRADDTKEAEWFAQLQGVEIYGKYMEDGEPYEFDFLTNEIGKIKA
jgi:hypothetical protein